MHLGWYFLVTLILFDAYVGKNMHYKGQFSSYKCIFSIYINEETFLHLVDGLSPLCCVDIDHRAENSVQICWIESKPETNQKSNLTLGKIDSPLVYGQLIVLDLQTSVPKYANQLVAFVEALLVQPAPVSDIDGTGWYDCFAGSWNCLWLQREDHKESLHHSSGLAILCENKVLKLLK